MKKILRILLPFMILMGVTGCMTKSVPANEQMVQYMESKYGESFTFLEYTGGKFGDSTFNGFVSSETFPDAKIFVTGDSKNPGVFSDNYVAFLQNEAACKILQDLAGEVDSRWKVFCTPETVGLPMDRETSALEYLQNGAALVTLFLPSGESQEQCDAQMEQFRQKLWEKSIRADMTVFLRSDDTLAGINRDNYRSESTGSYDGRFAMDQSGEFVTARCR